MRNSRSRRSRIGRPLHCGCSTVVTIAPQFLTSSSSSFQIESTCSFGKIDRGLKRADSWALDGHKWLQVPYDSGFAIVRDRAAHARAMAKTAGYLNEAEDDGRHPALYVPELSRRARGFAVWAMLQSLGREGLVERVRRHCAAARELALRCMRMEGVGVVNPVVLNQLALDFGPRTQSVCDAINEQGDFCLRTAEWRGRTILRVSFSGESSDVATAHRLADRIEAALAQISDDLGESPTTLS